MTISSEAELRGLIESQPVKKFHILLTIMCLLILTLDGFDMAIMGFVASSILDEWHISHEQIALAMTAGLIGLTCGALMGGNLADRFGRRKVILLSVVFFGAMSLLTAYATDITMLILLRFLTGLGLGAAQPNTATLISEYAPLKRRSVMICVIYCGITLGGALAGLIAREVIPDHGWETVFIIGGIVPLMLVVVLYFLIPESLVFLILKGGKEKYIQKILGNLVGSRVEIQSESWVYQKMDKPKAGFSTILSAPYILITLTFWAGLFTNLMAVNFLSNWLPLIVKENGFTLGDAALAGAIVQGGGTIGNILIGWAMDKYSYHRTMFCGLIIAIVACLLLTQVHNNFMLFCTLAFFLGLTVNSVNTGWTSLSARFYPTVVRATGTSVMTGIGRTGAIVGAFIGGILISTGVGMNTIFFFLAVPLSLCAISVILNLNFNKF